MLWMTTGKPQNQFKSNARDLKEWTNVIWKHRSLQVLPLVLTVTKSTQTAKRFFVPVLPDMWQQEGGNKHGMGERNSCPPCGEQWPSRRSLRTESHWREAAVQEGEQQAFDGQSLQGTWRPMPRSKYVGATIPAPALLSFPVASPIDVNLLTCDRVLTALEPKCHVVVVRCTWEEKKMLKNFKLAKHESNSDVLTV